MSTVCHLRQVTETQLAELLATPVRITAFVAEEPANEPTGLLGKLFGKKRAGTADSGERIDLATAWHGLHYLLTLTDFDGEEPLCFLLKGGTPIGDTEFALGPARALRPAQVRDFHTALATLTPDVLSYCFNPDDMTRLEIYPGIWDQEQALEYLLEYFHTLQQFVQQAADNGKGLVVYLN